MRLAVLVALPFLVAARPLHAQPRCDPAGNPNPVRFLSLEHYAGLITTGRATDSIEAFGHLPGGAGKPRWWTESEIEKLCDDPKVRRSQTAALCVAGSAHQNAMMALFAVTGELGGLAARIADKQKTCAVPAPGAVTGPKARAFWSCLGGFPLPESFAIAFKVVGKSVVQVMVRGSFLRGTPTLALRGETIGFGCGQTGWGVMQDEPLGWGTELQGSGGDVVWSP